MIKDISYNIGLDIGTNSVGWAVTDQQNNLLKFNKRNMWGVRIFEDAKTAETRRIHRSTRRRLDRRRARINLLQQLIGEDIVKKDPHFFLRLKESFLHQEDKDEKLTKEELKHILFNGEYTDEDYYKDYPTIYHLRNDLMNTNEKQDIRLVYLAIHNIIKYRGHFLYEGQKFSNDTSSIEYDFLKVLNFFQQEMGLNILNLEEKNKKIIKTLQRSDYSTSEKKDNINQILKSDKDSNKRIREFINSILGYKTKFNILFDIEDGQKELSFSLKDEYDEEEILQIFDQYAGVFLLIKKIYSWNVLQNVLKGHTYISTAMINKFNKHKKDLNILKRLFENYFPERYDFMFKNIDVKGKNYTNYVKHYKQPKSGKGIQLAKCSQEELYNSIKKIIEEKKYELENNKDYQYCINSIEMNDFLPKPTSKENASIPYQLHKIELKKILENQCIYYPEVAKNKDKIIDLLEFKIPYYVGPLNENSKDFAWIVKKQKGNIYPWNFDEIVDRDASAEKFINRMINKCTYLLDQDVLPKNSILYSEYKLLNELNKIRIKTEETSDTGIIMNGFLSVREKNMLIKDVFIKKKTVKEKDLIKWLIKNELINSENVIISGYQKENEFAASLTSYIDFSNIFGEINAKNYEMIEELIRWITIFEDKEILNRKIKQKYGNEKINISQIKQIVKLNYRGWGNLSKKLLDEISIFDKYGNRLTIMDKLRETNLNFMQIINDKKIGFKREIENANSYDYNKNSINYRDVEQLHGSPAIKRGIWQTIKIVEEIRKIMKRDPEKIIFEFAREEREKTRTTSRIAQLEKIYDKIKEESWDFNKNVYSEFKKAKSNKNKLDERRLFLYFVQNGKCMYTGEPLDIEKLSLYDIDHIIPRSYIKDNSIENLVLVKKIENQNKNDNMLINKKVIQKMHPIWENLYKRGLIGAKKFRNLSRNKFNEDELKGFINRQLVDTRQISKHLANLFNEVYLNTSIITIRSQLISDLRKKYDLYKLREINDYHHAHDAYLACSLATLISTRFKFIEGEFNYDDYLKTFYNNKIHLKENKYGIIIGAFSEDYRKDNRLWEGKKQIGKIKSILNYKDCNITKKAEELTGEFFDQTIYPKGRGTMPIKSNLPIIKYGGKNLSKNKAYFVLFQYKKGKKKDIKMEGIPVHIAYLIRDNKLTLLDYLEEIGYKHPRILKNRILNFQLVEEDGNKLFIVSNKDRHNAKQLLLNINQQKLIYNIIHNKKEFLNVDKECLILKDKLLITFYEEFIIKLKKEYSLFEKEIIGLESAKSEFESLDISQKIDFILELLKITKANGQYGKLKDFNLSYNVNDAGRNRRKFLWDKVVFIDQSITGLFEKRSTLYELENRCYK